MNLSLFIKKSLLYISLFIVLLYTIQMGVDKGLRKCYDKEPFATFNTVIGGKAGSEVVFLGSSRIRNHIDVPLFEKISGKTAFNLGLDGSNLFLQQTIWDLYRKNNKLPKILFMELDWVRLEKDKKIFDKYRFLPYLNDLEVSKVLIEINDITKSDLYIPLYKYRGYFQYMWLGINNLLLSSKTRINKKITQNKGFNSLGGHLRDTQVNLKNYKIEARDVEQSLAIISKINQQLKNEGSSLILINSPIFKDGYLNIMNKSEIENKVLMFLKKEQIEFQNFETNEPISFNANLFHDVMHLNQLGAKCFTTLLYEKNSKLINDK